MSLWDDIEDDIKKDDSRNSEIDFRNHQLLDNIAQLQTDGKRLVDEIKVLMEQLELEQPIISKKISF